MCIRDRVESVYGLSGLLHGEAVDVGMLPMIEESSLRERTRHIFETLSIDPDMPYDARKVYEVMTRDKKAYGSKITIVKVKECGKAYLQDIPVEELKAYLKGEVK